MAHKGLQKSQNQQEASTHRRDNLAGRMSEDAAAEKMAKIATPMIYLFGPHGLQSWRVGLKTPCELFTSLCVELICQEIPRPLTDLTILTIF